MPRKARLSVPGAVTHVMARCLDGLRLYKDEQDGFFFRDTLSRYLTETGCRCYAWVLMSNHYHLLLRLGDGQLWQTMKPLNMRLAQYHNSKYGHRGPVFIDRFKSIVTQDQNYVEELVRYVHLNPIRAGICKSLRSLESYQWSGHRALLGLDQNSLQDTKDVLGRFGKQNRAAREAYLSFLSDGMKDPSSDSMVSLVRSSNGCQERGRKPHRWVIGDPGFVKSVVDKSLARRLRISSFEKNGADLMPLALRVCKRFSISINALMVRHRGGPASNARSYFCYTATRESGAPAKAVSEFLGIHPTAVSAMIRKGRALINEHGALSI